YDLPPWARWWKRDGRAVHAYYALWQRCILGVARAAHAKHRFDLVHHITFGVWRQPSLLHRLGIPFVFGPVGGGEMAPWALERGQSVKLLAVAALRATANWASLLNPWLRASLRRASLVVAKTPETAAWIARAGVPCATALEIGIDAAAIQPRSDPNDAPRGPLRCMFAGRLIGMKGVDLALQAVAKARARGADVTLTIVGRGPLQQRLGERAAALGVESSIAFIDWLSQPALFEQYRRHDVLLFPSLHDSSGNVVLEAFAHGLPVVCLALGGPGVMVDPSCGVAVAVHGLSRDEVSTALAQVLVEFAQDRTRVGRLARAARARALACTWQAAVRQTYARVAAVDGVDRRADA
ncbi:MAG: glycosyltransferase family 4 protein, partial [Rubrivivax sp.]|nr:glycosyltransferase family 4 protein [Rubrivivax sp.]